MYSLEIRDHVMIAHSIPGEVFGPAQKLHGATYVVDVAFMSETLDANDIVVDIGLATKTVGEILAAINYCNLDDHAAFRGKRSTTEAVAFWVFSQVRDALVSGKFGPVLISRVKVTLHESHLARASYEAELGNA
jgi:6-pyruvoyltetrahydropterin/6-carboxytetrahydropterin synthase